MEEWINNNLSQLLNFEVPPDLTEYIMQIQDDRDLDEYLKTLLNYGDPKHKQFIINLKKRKGELITAKKEKSHEKPSNKKKGKSPKLINVEAAKEDKDKEKTEKKKTKFVNLYSNDGKSTEILLKGRHKCDCEAKQHRLINNCTNCGRIVCMQEGSGPCFFCNELVCSSDQQKILSSNTKQADSLYNKLMDQKSNASLEESLKHRDKLLEFDRNSEQRTKVIDDESDYFQSSSNTWLTKEERAAMKKKEEEMLAKKHESRLKRKVTLDFAGRQIIDEENDDNFCLQDMQMFAQSCQNKEMIFHETDLLHRPVYMPLDSQKVNAKHNIHPYQMKTRIQDKEYLEMSDEGKCISIQQPYASLLVTGIKKHEERNWYTSHRGRLWIASAASPPNQDDIQNSEHFYSTIYQHDNIKFPRNYPTGVLLGCVTLVDVLTQEEYRKRYPHGEGQSPFVFICENPYELSIRFPIKGKHKIYQLDEKVHRAALNALDKVMQDTSNYSRKPEE